MKTKKGSHGKAARTQISRKRAVHRRPAHKRVLLHPFSAFLLLCVGVLVAGSTFHGRAVTYDVTAKVPAPALTEAAVITEPSDQAHVSFNSLGVSGTCPANSYVKLFRQDIFAGVDACSGGRFHVLTSLSPGANELNTRVFNTTDDEGPASPPVTVYYDLPPASSSPPATPTSLQISNIEEDVYEQGLIREVSSNPTVSGWAPPFSEVVVTFYSEPSICKTKADSKGAWSCTLAHALPPGIHHVVIEATTPSGERITFPTFQIRVVEYARPFVITSDYAYRSYKQGQRVEWKLALSGGTAPYQLLIDWGDGKTENLVRQDQTEFTIAHEYAAVDVEDNYEVLITATDARGATTLLQLAAVVTGGAPLGAKDDVVGGIAGTIREWLWVVWPAYIAVILMVISFWIGEQEAYKQFIARRKGGRRPHARSR